MTPARRILVRTLRRIGLIGAALALLLPPAWAAGEGPGSAPPAFEKVHPNYLGWRMFQQKCARCHGPDATGTDQAPDLLPRVAEMSERRFAGTVLKRYAWLMPADEARGESAAREALIEQVLQKKKGLVDMPAWQDEPHVSAHIGDLYAYLRARSEGTLPAGRPAP